MFLRLAVLVLACLSAVASAQDPWQPSNLMQPAELAARLKTSKPRVYYVGFGVLYRNKHIPGAIFAGPGSKQEGLQLLRESVLKLARNEEVIIYCGCCPWERCPNLRPAFLMLRELGFQKIKVLALPTNFLTDWIEKGYPTEQGEAAR